VIGTPTRLWTCDRCETSMSVIDRSGPEGWHVVSAVMIPQVRKAADPQVTRHWCGPCVAEVFGPPRTWSR